MRGRILVLVVGLGYFALSGCGSKPPGKVPVNGKVLFQGDPLEGGKIVFTPDTDRGTQGPLARAEIQTDGSFTLASEDAPGVAPGWYRVTVAGKAESLPTPRNPYPAPPPRYRNPELSGLLCEVKQGSDNFFELKLTD